MPKKSFSIEDLEKWQQRGLLSEEQLKAILAEEGVEAEAGAKESRAGLNAVTVAYYFGGILAFFSFTFFIGMNWRNLTDWERLGITLGAMLIIGLLGAWLRFMRGYPTAGGLLLFVATAIFPLFIYTVQKSIGVWPDHASSYELRLNFLYLALVGLAGAVAMLVLTRFHLISLIVAALVHLTVLDIAQFTGGEVRGWRYIEELTTATGGGLALLGIALTLWGKKPQAFWFKLYGLAGFQFGFTYIYFERFGDSALFGLFYLLVFLGIIGVSLYFREVIFLVFGAIGTYIYITNLVFDTFRGTAYFPLLLGAIGLSIIVLTVLYQRYRARLFRRA